MAGRRRPRDEEAHHEAAHDLVTESCIAVFDRFYFLDAVEGIDSAELGRVLVVVWLQRSGTIDVFAITHDDNLVRVKQSEDVQKVHGAVCEADLAGPRPGARLQPGRID